VRTETRNIEPTTTRGQAVAAGNAPIQAMLTGTNLGDIQGEVIYDNTSLLPITKWTNNIIDV
jgi:hypothetical protein